MIHELYPLSPLETSDCYCVFFCPSLGLRLPQTFQVLWLVLTCDIPDLSRVDLEKNILKSKDIRGVLA